MAITYPIYVLKENPELSNYEGCVLGEREENLSDESYFYAIVWDEKEGCIKEVQVGSWTYGAWPCKIDYTPEVGAKAEEWLYQNILDWLNKENEVRAQKPAVGKLVKITNPRAKHFGASGVAFWQGRNKFDRHSKDDANTGFKTDTGETIFTATANLGVLAWEQYLVKPSRLEYAAQRSAAVRNWRGIVSYKSFPDWVFKWKEENWEGIQCLSCNAFLPEWNGSLEDYPVYCPNCLEQKEVA